QPVRGAGASPAFVSCMLCPTFPAWAHSGVSALKSTPRCYPTGGRLQGAAKGEYRRTPPPVPLPASGRGRKMVGLSLLGVGADLPGAARATARFGESRPTASGSSSPSAPPLRLGEGDGGRGGALGQAGDHAAFLAGLPGSFCWWRS